MKQSVASNLWEQQTSDDEQTLIYLKTERRNWRIWWGNFTIVKNCLTITKSLMLFAASTIYSSKGKWKEAIDFMKSVISSNPRNDHLLLTLAELYSNEGENDKAILIIKRAGLIFNWEWEKKIIERKWSFKSKIKTI